MSSCSPSELVNVELPYMGYAITSAGVGRGLPLDKAEIYSCLLSTPLYIADRI
jgi:hypothetical protein